MQSFDDLRWNLTNAGIDRQDLRLHVQQPSGSSRWVTLRLSQLESNDADAAMFRSIGLLAPWMEPAIGEVLPGSAAERSGLQQGDVVLSVDGQPVADAQQLRASIQRGVRDGQGIVQAWQVSRQGQSMALSVQPDVAESPAGNGESIGRVGAYIGAAPQMVRVSHGPVDGLWMGVTRTWEMSWLTLKMIGRMVIGEASVKNLSGPLTIADYAGKSASLGVTQYLLFLALISVSLGVLNLLPLPVLDGGHLIYYLWEAVTGKTVSDQWMERLQRGGVAVLLVMMSIALFNDFARLLG